MRTLTLYIATLLLALSLTANANASILQGLIAGANNLGGTQLQLSDDSRDFFIDVDESGGITDGDVLFGVVQVDSSSPPSIATNNQIYGVFSQQFSGISNPGGPATTFSGSFVPTTAGTVVPSGPFMGAGLDLNSLTGGALGIDPSAFFAVFESPGGFAVDIDSLNAPDAGLGIFTPFDVLSSIAAEGDFVASVGFRDGPGGPTDGPFSLPDTGDFFVFESDVALAAVDSVVTGTPPPNTLQLGTFGAGLSVLDNNLDAVILDDLVAISSDGPGGNTFAEVIVTGGTFSGVPSPENGLFPIINNADFTVSAIAIPEPTTFVVWGLLGSLAVNTANRRRS